MKTASVLISCLDRPGIVARVSEFLVQHGVNLSSLEQHIEDGYFFMRVQWQILDSDLKNEQQFMESFEPIRVELDAKVKVDFGNKKKRIAIFCSKELHCLMDILLRVEINEINAEVVFVASNFDNAESLASKFNIPFFITGNGFGREKDQLDLISNHSIDLVVLARYMRILSSGFIEKVGGEKIINVHHSFLPSFIGADPYEQAHLRGVKLIGATSHYVIPELDAGPIIEQNVKRISHAHDVQTLKMVGRDLEKEVFAVAIKKHLENKLLIHKNRVVVFA